MVLFCTNCGATTDEKDAFCRNCGTQLEKIDKKIDIDNGNFFKYHLTDYQKDLKNIDKIWDNIINSRKRLAEIIEDYIFESKENVKKLRVTDDYSLINSLNSSIERVNSNFSKELIYESNYQLKWFKNYNEESVKVLNKYTLKQLKNYKFITNYIKISDNVIEDLGQEYPFINDMKLDIIDYSNNFMIYYKSYNELMDALVTHEENISEVLTEFKQIKYDLLKYK